MTASRPRTGLNGGSLDRFGGDVVEMGAGGVTGTSGAVPSASLDLRLGLNRCFLGTAPFLATSVLDELAVEMQLQVFEDRTRGGRWRGGIWAFSLASRSSRLDATPGADLGPVITCPPGCRSTT